MNTVLPGAVAALLVAANGLIGLDLGNEATEPRLAQATNQEYLSLNKYEIERLFEKAKKLRASDPKSAKRTYSQALAWRERTNGLVAELLFTLNPMADSLDNRITVQIPVALIQPGC